MEVRKLVTIRETDSREGGEESTYSRISRTFWVEFYRGENILGRTRKRT